MKQTFITLRCSKSWLAESPNLPGCVCVGSTQEEALESMRSKIRAYRDEGAWSGQESELLIVAL